MTTLKTFLLFFALSTQSIWAQSYIDQKDSFFIANKIIPSPKESSLCGPVSFMNWLIYENKINDDEARELLKTLDQAKKGGINHGHTGRDLIALMGRAEEQILDQSTYKSHYSFRLNDIFKNETQLLLLKFSKLPTNRSGRFGEPPPFDGINEEQVNRTFLHFVLKVPASNGQIQLIDPEQPQRKIIISAKEEGGKILLSDEHYKYFGYSGFIETHEVQIIEVITKLL